MKPSSIGIGFSHQSVPSLSKTATRSSGGTDCAAPSANSTIACFVARVVPGGEVSPTIGS